ncbi:MAG: hypothetical protein FKY71_08630 [Spiribacter salinus]|uniref:Uncharacterized protein n=1 Tax=Spiribacter salinus TaxID=1335746 RepID=A0A540VRZ3_9GAMM|nr:MAG: hypothetical protein FKY71_08630 [Spiribacter salinus]
MRDVMQELCEARATRPTFPDYPDFQPFASPAALLRLGIFDGKYFDDSPLDVCGLRIESDNLFAPNASQTREQWRRKGWLMDEDPLGWFQWYVRFNGGRRLGAVDRWQIKRWKGFKARQGGMLRYQSGGDIMRGTKLRQAHLHWACWPLPDIGQPEKMCCEQ